MTESSEQNAPSRGTPTDSPVGTDAAEKTAGEPAGGSVDEPEKTMDTPDELGGTGGEQAGGAG